MPAPSDAAATVLAAYADAVYDKDVDALCRLYDDDVRVFDMWETWSYEGLAAWRETLRGWFDSLGDERVRVTAEDVRTRDAGAGCVVSAIVTYQGLAAAGSPLRSMQNRLSWLLVDRGGAWQIVHEHTSAPIGMEDEKAILSRSGGA